MSEAQTLLTVLAKAIEAAVRALRGTANVLQAALHQVGLSHGDQNSSSHSVASSDWDVLSSVPDPPAPLDFSGPAYQAVFDSFPDLPISCSELCASLSGDSKARARRAWEAGCWARAFVDGRVPRPKPSPQLGFKPSVFIDLRSPRITEPVRVRTATEFTSILGFGISSIGHSFPSVSEATLLQCLWH